MNDKLKIPFTREEVRKDLFDLNQPKAPGPDGYTALFFQDAWGTIGEEITDVALRVLNQREPLHSWNPTVVTLIPKIKDLDSVKDFRSISLCNISYKIIARAITNRL